MFSIANQMKNFVDLFPVFETTIHRDFISSFGTHLALVYFVDSLN